MSSIVELTDLFSQMLRQFDYPLESWGINYIGVLSIRPMIQGLAGQKIVWAKDYNFVNESSNKDKKEERDNKKREKWIERDKLRKQRNVYNPHIGSTTAKKKPQEKDKDFTLEESYFHVLSELDEECKRFNEETESNVTPGSCVKQVTGIRERKCVERLDFNQILHEHKSMIEKGIEIQGLDKMIINQQLEINHHERILKKYGKISRPLSDLNKSELMDGGTQTDVQSHDNQSQTVTSMVDVAINREIAIARIRSFNMHGMANFLKRVKSVCQIMSDEVNPHEEALIMGALPKPIDPITDIVKKLIEKASKGSQYLLGLMREFCDQLGELSLTLVNSIYELD